MSQSSSSSSNESPSGASVGGGEIVLFGVRVKVDPMRKSVSMNNLSQYEPVHNNNSSDDVAKADDAVNVGYASAEDAVPQPSNAARERKRGVPWTEEEHKLFLIGLQKVGKGDWRGISRNYVKTRTPTQVASHAQKYFLRRSNLNRRRRRSSLFDITTDSVTAMHMEEIKKHEERPTRPITSNTNGFSVVPFPVNVGPVLFSLQGGNPVENPAFVQTDQANNFSSKLVRPVPVLPRPASSLAMVDLNFKQQMPIDPSPLSLGLSLSSGWDQPSTRDAGLQVMPGFKSGDSIIRVA